jgi:hypothetical protein
MSVTLLEAYYDGNPLIGLMRRMKEETAKIR